MKTDDPSNFLIHSIPTASVQADTLLKKSSITPTLQIQPSNLLEVERSVPLQMVQTRDTVVHRVRRPPKAILSHVSDSIYRANLAANPPAYAQDLTEMPWQLPLLPKANQSWVVGVKTSGQVKQLDPGSIPARFPDWTLFIWIGSLAILLWVRKSFSRYFSQVLLSWSDFNLSMNLFKDRNILLQRVSNLLQVNFILVLSLFLFLFIPLFSIPSLDFNIKSWLIVCSIPITLVLFRNVINRVLGYLFSRERVFLEYNYHVQMNYKALGIILLPLIILILYFNLVSSKTLLIISLIVIISLYFHRIYRGYKIIVLHHVSVFYTILYLCTFEILPLIMIYKAYRSISG